MTITDPFGTPGPVPLPDRGDPFGVPSDSGRATRMGDAEDRAEVPRDQWDRYLLHHLDGTKPAANKGFTRVSTTKSALSNTFGIQDWAKRRVIEGVGKDETLVAEAIRASRMPDGKDKEKALRRVASAGFDLGGGKERSGLGTEFHELTEDQNRGELNPQEVDPKWAPELNAYNTMLRENDIRIRPEYLERQVLCPYNNAGTFDNIVEWWNPDTEEWELVVADLKTGRSLDLGWLEIEMQLWLYANAYGLWTTTNIVRNDPKDPDKITDVEGFYEPMPRELRRDKALIFHVPLDGTATLYVIDLSGVDTYVEAAVTAKRANAEAKNKVRKISTYRPAAFVAPELYGDDLEQALKYRADVAAEQQAQKDARSIDRLNNLLTTPPVKPVTPDQQAQIDKAAERLARVNEMAIATGRNDGDVPEDSPTSDASVTTPPVTIERDPVTGRKKRTCGYCHKPGHTQKTCPSNPASAKYQKPELKVVPEPADPGEPEPENTVSYDQKDHPYCLKTHPHPCTWTATHPDAPGQWVCAVSGKPGRTAYQVGATAVTNQPPTYGAPDYAVGDTVTVAGIEFTKHSEPPTWAAPPDMVAWAISQATTATEVLMARHNAMEAGTWIQDKHDAPAMARYTELNRT